MFSTFSNISSVITKASLPPSVTISPIGVYGSNGMMSTAWNLNAMYAVCSDNGQYVCIGAYVNSTIYYSTNGGASWATSTMPTSPPAAKIGHMSMSSSGQYIVASYNGFASYPLYSQDYGATFTFLNNITNGASSNPNAQSASYGNCTAISSDGQYVYISSDINTAVGGLYVCTTAKTNGPWTHYLSGVDIGAVCCDPTGQFVLCGTCNVPSGKTGYQCITIYSSSYGSSFIGIGSMSSVGQTAGQNNARCIKMSQDGNYMLECNVSPNNLYYSNTGGSSFTSVAQFAGKIYNGLNGNCSMSSTGKLMTIVFQTGLCYYSINYGSTWADIKTINATISTTLGTTILDNAYVSPNGQYIIITTNNTSGTLIFIIKMLTTN